MKTIAATFLVIAAIAVLSVHHPHAPAALAANPSPNPAFAALIPALKQQTRAPVLLPTHIPPNLDTAGSAFGSIVSADAKHYTLYISTSTQGCKALACEYGTLRAITIDASTPPLSGTLETLSDGTKAYYTKFGCGMVCGDSTLAWNKNGYRYTEGLRHEPNLQPLLDMANSFAQF